MLLFCGAIASLWVTIAVHESAHLFVALALRLPVHLFAIKPLQLIRMGKAFRLRLFLLPLTLQGLVLVHPVTVYHLRLRMLLMVAAGPFANAIVAILCLVLASFVDPDFPSVLPPTSYAIAARAGWASSANPDLVSLLARQREIYWLELAALLNVCCCVVTLIPGKSGTFLTDGQHILGYLGLSSVGKRDFLVLTLRASMAGGTRPSAWPVSVVRQMLALRGGTFRDFDANCYGYYHATDCKDWTRAGEYLDLALAQCERAIPIFRAAILLEKAYFEAFHRQNANARTWLAQAKTEGIEKHTRLRAEAAVWFVEGNYTEAAATAQAGLDVVSQSQDRGGSLAEAEWLQILLAESQKRLPANSDQSSAITMGTT